jgi:hypothetical protein
VPEKKIEQNSTANMQDHIGEMETEFIGVPKKVIDKKRHVLDGAIMAGERVEEQIMSEALQDKEWAFDEGIVVREILVVPNALALERGRAHEDAD